MQMKSSVVVLSSFLLTTFVSWAVYNKKKQFYPTVVYLTNNQPCLAILLFQCAVLLFLFAKLSIRIFFGRLQQVEIDNLVSQSWYAFFDLCLVFAFFQDELGMEFLFLFSILLLIRAFHWLIEERVDYLERTPAITVLFHLRVISLISLLAVFDAYFIRKTYLKPSTHGLSVHVALGIEYLILLLNLFSIILRYIMHSIDSMREHPWDKKTMYLLFADIIFGFIRLAIYIEFSVVMWTLHPFPLFIVRPIYLSVRTLKKSIQDVIMSRRAIRYMNTVFSNATTADLEASSDTVCIICREEMQSNASGVPRGQDAALKKLPCSHIFHTSCLRSWFQRQQTCPTCRMDIIQHVRQQELRGHRPAAQGQSDSSARSNGPTSASTSSSSSVGQQGPFWMPPSGMFPGWPLQPPTTSSQSQNVPPFPFPPPPFFPPFMGAPIIYPGNLFPTTTLPMPAPPTGEPGTMSESQLRASAEARFVALRQINILLNAAVLQMNTYLNAVTSPPIENNPWINAFSQQPVNNEESGTVVESAGDVSKTVPAELDHLTSKSEEKEADNLNADLPDGDLHVRRRPVEHFKNPQSEKTQSD